MNLLATVLLAFSMSADAFAAAIARGASMGKPSNSHIVKIALTFGVVETITPLIGYGAGTIAAPYIEAFDHWIAFGLLLVLGGKMIWESFSPDDEDEAETAVMPSKWFLLITAIATSIDSMIVGVTLAFLDVNIWLTALAIGSATTLMAAIGVKLGGVLGDVVGKRAEFIGGLVLIGIGTFILLEHLGYL
ncbi:manganese efflux pump MntP family protein [Kingella negevensis]|uniref:manganese efflux pump MntP n=1 Tax=Kingella negevensis TaxID=1522312 RepID=UPI00254BF23F|nr:manganese efflux pump MntP family protein [Kingella negevensis]MDK4684558.1 manganese efflux pump MntP family protein [Kingella negevensis]MDK4707686.1 manganese efflux pump MntP family protein [Kingella negevensis]MDK4709878.1 manganese efflux pump MntP family protein [Kingella negevensis]